MQSPEEVRTEFAHRMQTSAWDAVEYLHDLEEACGYLHPKVFNESDPTYFVHHSPYGRLEITINTVKPEKDPAAIVAEAKTEESGDAPATNAAPGNIPRPQCDLCWENEEYPGDSEHPAKPGLRIVPITLNGEQWGLQYSPYGYFEYHCIALDAHHVPMHISADTFPRLFDFLDLFPFFFIGTNADLPYVGGSILSHEHMQGGRHRFALMDAPFETLFKPTDEVVRALNLEHDVLAGTVAWPATVVRLVSPHRPDLEKLATHILKTWQAYALPEANIVNDPDAPGGLHNTINAIAYKDADGVYGEPNSYVLDIVLRNNVTDADHPFGVFHPDTSLHHIKKENIGLIEIMGLAIFPGRLARELPLVERALNAVHAHVREKESEPEPESEASPGFSSESQADAAHLLTTELARLEAESGEDLTQHEPWAQELLVRLDAQTATAAEVARTMQESLGEIFEKILAACGVFKRTPQGQKQYRGFIELFAYYI